MKPIEDVMKDPRGLYHVGQLIGASEMASHWMRQQEDPTVKRMGDKLAESVGWFFDSPPPSAPAEEVTKEWRSPTTPKARS